MGEALVRVRVRGAVGWGAREEQPRGKQKVFMAAGGLGRAAA